MQSGESSCFVTNILQKYKIKVSAFSLSAEIVSLFSALKCAYCRFDIELCVYITPEAFWIGSDIFGNLLFDFRCFPSSKFS